MKRAKSNGVDNNNNKGATGRLGYSVSELVDRLSRIYSLKPSRAFERKVSVALKRGVDYGILVESRNRYRYDPEQSLKNSLAKGAARKRRGKAPTARRRATRRVSHPSPPTSASSSKRNKPRVPRPTVPPPPTFQRPPKNLTREPFNKVIKHSSHWLR